MVSVGISKLGLWDLLFVHQGVKIIGSYYQVIIISWTVHFFGTQCSFVDEIKLNYSLTNTTLNMFMLPYQVVYTVVSVKMSLSELL